MKIAKRLKHYFKQRPSNTVKSSRSTKGKTGCCRHCQRSGVIQYVHWPVTVQTIPCHTISTYPVAPASPVYYLSPDASVFFNNGQSIHNRSNTPVYTTQVMAYTSYAGQSSPPINKQSDETPQSIPTPPPLPLTASESSHPLRPALGHRIVPPTTRPEATALPALAKEEQDFIDILNDYVTFHNTRDGKTSNHHPLNYIEKPTQRNDDQIIRFIGQIKQALQHYKISIQSSGLNSYAYDSLCRQLINKYR